jgi:hypothetical protein
MGVRGNHRGNPWGARQGLPRWFPRCPASARSASVQCPHVESGRCAGVVPAMDRECARKAKTTRQSWR